VSTIGGHVRQRHTRTTAGTRSTHGSPGFDPEVEGIDWFVARDGEQVQSGDIAPGAVEGIVHILPSSIDLSLFADTIRVPSVVDSLPTLPDAVYPPGALVFWTSDGKLYRNVGDDWTVAIEGGDIIAGSITAGQIAAGAIGAAQIAADAITADMISGGILVIRPITGFTQGIRMEDAAGVLLANWSPTGLQITDPTNPSRYVLLDGGMLRFTTDAGATFPTAITPDGINASSINFGALPGGGNLVPNSSFELSGFVAVALQASWSVAADWNASRDGTDTNVSTNANDLSQTGMTY
jgi:hypothetical protein